MQRVSQAKPDEARNSVVGKLSRAESRVSLCRGRVSTSQIVDRRTEIETQRLSVEIKNILGQKCMSILSSVEGPAPRV